MTSLYQQLSRVRWIKDGYPLKFLFVAFIGIHIPLIGLFACILGIEHKLSSIESLLIILGFTLLATMVTLVILRKLISPVIVSSDALKNYLDKGELPRLPIGFPDEVGQLMTNLQQTIVHIDKLNKQNKDIIALLSHDMRSPLNSLLGICELLDINNENEESQQYVQLIRRCVKGQLTFLEDMINMLRISDNNEGKIVFEKLEVNILLEELRGNLSPQLSQKEIRLQLEMDKLFYVVGNSSLLKQVFTNLITNAIKFSQKGQNIVIQVYQAGKDKLIVAVKDQGIGFDMKKSEALFDRFTKMGRKGTHNECSTGIGLYLVRQIVQMHAGQISAQSEGVNKGATFLVELKLA